MRFRHVLDAMREPSRHVATENVQRMNMEFMQQANEHISLNLGALACLEDLKARGLRSHVLTNGPSDGQRRKLSCLGLERLVDQVFISEETRVAKPSLQAFRNVLDQLGVAAGSVVMVGDSLEQDILPAQKVGMRPLHFRGPTTSLAPVIQQLDEVSGAISLLF